MDESSVQHPGTEGQPSALESEIKQLRERHQARFAQLSTLMSSLQGISEAVREEGDSLDALEHSAQGQLHYLKKSLEETVSGQGNLEARIAELTAALENAEREKSALAEQMTGAESSNTELESLRAELTAKDGALADLEGQLEAARGAGEMGDRALEEALQRAQAAEERLHTIEAEMSGQGDDSARLNEELGALRADIAEKDRALQDAQAALDEAQEQQNRVGEEFERLKNAQQQAEATQEGLKTELVAVQRELESLREKYREGLSTEAALALRQQVTDMAEEVASLGQQLSEAREMGRKSALAQQLTEAIKESERLEDENLRLKQQLGIVEDGREYLVQEILDMEPAGAAVKAPQVSRSEKDELQRIQESATKWTHGPKRVIGQILLDADVITEDQLKTALDLQKSNPQQHLGSLLAELGFASDEAVAQARASQCGVAYIRFDETTVDPDAASLITQRLASQHNCIPISATESDMVLAVTNPMDLLAIEDVERFSNRKVEVVVGTGPDIEMAISRFYWEPE